MKSENKLAYFSSLYENAREKQAALYDAMRKAFAQYRGESAFYGEKQAGTIRNITYELIEGQVSTDIPRPQVTGKESNERKNNNARKIELLLAGLRDELPFEKMNDLDERYTYIYGGSIFLAEWDESISRPLPEGGEAVGGVRILSLSPLDFVGQPGIYEIDDMDYCFLVFETTRSDIRRRYGPVKEKPTATSNLLPKRLKEAMKKPVAEPAGEPAVEMAIESPVRPQASLPDACDEAVEVIVCYYKDGAGRIGRFLWSEDQVLSDIEDFYARKRKICRHCGREEGLCDCASPDFALVSEEEEILTHDIVRADGSVLAAGTRLLRYRPHRFPVVVRKNTSLERSLIGQSDCHFIAPQQREINEVLSRLHEKLMMAGVYPFKPDDCQFRYDNSVGGKVLNLRPGETPDQFGVLDTTPDIAKDLEYIAATYEDAKRILGLSDSYLGGNEGQILSGRARSILVAQSEGRLSSKRVMKNAAYAELDRLIFELYLAYADEPRAVYEKDAFGHVHKDAFSRYDFLVQDPVTGVYRYDDAYLFSVDTSLPAKDDRPTLWKYNLENYESGSFGAVGSHQALTRYWAIQERCGYPGAKECLSFFIKEEADSALSSSREAKPPSA